MTEAHRRYRLSEKGKRTVAAWNAAHKDQLRTHQRRYSSSEKARKTKQSWRVRNKDKIRKWKREWAASPAGRVQARSWYKKSPRAMYSLYKAAAARRGLPFVLTLDAFLVQIVRPCTYCGSPPPEESGRNGLDRIDNTRGYTRDNVVPCCFVCNQMKGTRTVAEFLAHVTCIQQFQENKHE